MALVPIISQTWDTTSVFTPTRMNTIENNIAIAATAEGTKYSNGVSVKDKIDSMLQTKIIVFSLPSNISSYAVGDSITFFETNDDLRGYTLLGLSCYAFGQLRDFHSKMEQYATLAVNNKWQLVGLDLKSVFASGYNSVSAKAIFAKCD